MPGMRWHSGDEPAFAAIGTAVIVVLTLWLFWPVEFLSDPAIGADVSNDPDIDAEVFLDQVSATSEEAQVELRYRVASPEPLGQIRLFIDVEPTNAGPSDSKNDTGQSLRASLMAGDQEIAAQRLPLDSWEDEPLRLEPDLTWRPASGADVDSGEQAVFINEAARREGFVLGEAGPNAVVEGTLTSHVSRAREAPLKVLKVNTYVRNAGSDEWDVRTDAAPGDRLELLIRAENVGETVLEKPVFGVNLADYQSLVPGSTVIILVITHNSRQ